MKRFIFCISLALTGLMTACVEKNEAVDADSKPAWLGGSIYQELKNPQHLEGTFNNYLRLIDDLGYKETLDRTGSMTVFPANDEAFERFFASNEWGVHSYEELSLAQRSLLLKNSMLKNALLIGMLSNASGGTDAVKRGQSMKHLSSQETVDTIQHLLPVDMPKNNYNWDGFRADQNMYLVNDASTPMIVHFTREHMLMNGITTQGPTSDFAILTGSEYKEGMAYIFGDQVIKSDVTCMNGYVHQMQDVIVPPGNMAQVLQKDDETSIFSHIIEYYSRPVESAEVTAAYNSWAESQREAGNNVPTISQVYEKRYFNDDNNDHKLVRDINNMSVDYALKFDPGWNQYSPSQSTGSDERDKNDVAAMLVPTDKAMEEFFTVGGAGAYLIDLYGDYPGADNTKENLIANLDAFYNKEPSIVTDFVRNLMKKEFTNNVPSKFSTVTNDVQDFMGLTVDDLSQKSDGKYNISVANNGVIYKLNKMIPPDKYQSVMAPAITFPDMHIMKWAIEDDATLGVSFHYYLMAMKAKYAFFTPDDEAFEHFYVDPISLGTDQPQALKFTYRPITAVSGTVDCTAYKYNPKTGDVTDRLTTNKTNWHTLFVDILNFHTVVLDSTEVFGEKHFYKTKHGGTIRVDGVREGDVVLGGQQIDNGREPATIETVYPEKNGTAFRINRIIEGPRNSVSSILQKYNQFSEFYKMCSGFSVATQVLTWAGISSEANDYGISEQDSYTIFTSDRRKSKDEVIRGSCPDANVKMFNTYNYTLYAPNNTAMAAAIANGLPNWDTVMKIFEDHGADSEAEAAPYKKQVKDMITEMRDFVRYHFQSVSVYADTKVDAGKYNSLSTDANGIAKDLTVTEASGNGVIYVRDGAGNVREVNSSRLHNLMARDMWFDKPATEATDIYTSSFCVIHELNEPLYAK